MLTSRIKFKNFQIKSKNPKTKKILNALFSKKSEVLNSLSKSYKKSFNSKLLNKYKSFSNFRVIGMGGSSLGSKAIYFFLRKKIKKSFEFFDNLSPHKKTSKKGSCNLIISKSGNTVETIINANVFINKNDKNIFITEKKNNYLLKLAEKLKSEIIHHNNYIGGRYSVLSEVGMVPAELMGLKSKNFKDLNNLIKNKKFTNALISNVNSILSLSKKKKFNSIIINYDEQSESLFNWYQQLVAESLGKKNKGILPVISIMPRDNHSVMQLYLDGFKNNFFTFFSVKEKQSPKIKNNSILHTHQYLKNKKIYDIIYSQKQATENVFYKKNIPFRSFEIKERNEKTLGELFTFFILETILLAKCLKLDPFNQPSVELIKTETKKILI